MDDAAEAAPEDAIPTAFWCL